MGTGPYMWMENQWIDQTCISSALFPAELQEENLLLCVWLPTNANMVDMYMENMSPCLYHHHSHIIMHDDDESCHQYLHKILDISHITISNSPGEGVGTG